VKYRRLFRSLEDRERRSKLDALLEKEGSFNPLHSRDQDESGDKGNAVQSS